MRKTEVPFGHGSFVGQIMADKVFFERPIAEQAQVAGWADGCPVVNELIDPENPNPGRGAEAMFNRYNEVNVWFRYIANTTEESNPALYQQLMQRVKRMPDEPPMKYEPESVPVSFLGQMSPMGTIAGFALPRVFIEQLGTNTAISYEEAKERFVEGLSLLDDAISEAKTPLELLAIMAEGLTTSGHTDKSAALKHVLGTGWMDEHNAPSMIAELKSVMQEKAPRLWSFYAELSEEDKREQKLV